MISRRSFLGISAATVSAPLWAGALSAPLASAAVAAPESLKFNLVNNSGATAYAYIVGSHGTPEDDGRPVFVQADGTAYFPPRPGGDAVPLEEDCAIPVEGSTEVVVPRMYGARIYFVTEEKLEFLVVQGEGDKAAIAHPDFVSDSDANYGKNWTFSEFTLNAEQIYANISYVDFVAAPIGLKLDHAGGVQEVPGLSDGAVDKIAASLREADDGKWSTCVQEVDGKVIRILNPNHRPQDFEGYLEGYVDEVWSKYSSETLTIDSQRDDVGILEGTVTGDELVFGSESFQKPTSADIWGCNSGPFANNPDSDSEERKAIVPRLAAAFNRTTLLINSEQPHGERPETFYENPVTNHYARVVHENLPDGKGYAFAYDDVSSNAGEDHSGKVNHGEPELLTVTLNKLR